MSNLPGVSTIHVLPLNGALARCQLWQRGLTKTLKVQCAGLAATSNILATCRSLRGRLMRRMSVAMHRRRAGLNFLEKKDDTTSTTNAGHARLPVTTRRYPRIPAVKRLCQQPLNIWANLQSQRCFATSAEQRKTAKRLSVPVLQFVEQPDNKVEDVDVEVQVNSETAADIVDTPKDTSKKRRMVPIMHFLNDEAKLARSPSQVNAINKKPSTIMARPIVSAKHSVARGRAFAVAKTTPSALRVRYDMQRPADKQFNMPKNFNALKRSSSLQFMMSKYPLMHKLRTPALPYLKSTNGMEQGLDTFETRLRALRTAQPLHLRLPSIADSDYLNVTQQYRRYRKSRYAYMHEEAALPNFKKFGSMNNFRSTTSSLPSVKAHRMQVPQRKLRNRLNAKPRQAKKSPMPNPKQMKPVNSVKIDNRPEREDLSHLLGDLLDKGKNTESVSIEFNKTAPLFKLVTTSMEGRTNLHRRTFSKDLESPQLFRHPTIRNLSQLSNTKRRGVLGQSASLRAKTLLENKLTRLLKAARQDEEYDDEDDIEDDHEH